MATQGNDSIKRMVDWKLKHDVEDTRKAIVQRARSLAEDLTRLAEGLERDANYSFNTLGVLQGNSVELDTWCVKLGYQRETLKLLEQALAYDEDGESKTQ